MKAFVCLMVVSVTIFISSHYSFAKCPTRMGSLYPQDNFWVIAHRGSVTKFPENTFPAFQEALDIDGANSLEIDLSLTNDKKVVLWHDWDPNSPTALIRQGEGSLLSNFYLLPLHPVTQDGDKKPVNLLCHS